MRAGGCPVVVADLSPTEYWWFKPGTLSSIPDDSFSCICTYFTSLQKLFFTSSSAFAWTGLIFGNCVMCFMECCFDL